MMNFDIFKVSCALFLGFSMQINLANVEASSNTKLAEKYKSGREVYNYRCYYCHGYSGDAKTLATRFVTPKPLDFTTLIKDQLTASRMSLSITNGREGTAMPAFGNTLSESEISDVIYYIEEGFINAQEKKTGYHTAANGWQDHREKYSSAFPFVLGELSVKAADSELTITQIKGREIFFTGCITCHEVWNDDNPEQIWQPRAVSFPRSHSPFKEPDAITEATVYSKHEKIDSNSGLDQLDGSFLYQQNCAFCHSPNRTGKNWIGNFLEPHPRDLTDIAFLQSQTLETLSVKIAMGVADSSMPRWDLVLSKQQIEKIACFLLLAAKEIAACEEKQDDEIPMKMNRH